MSWTIRVIAMAQKKRKHKKRGHTRSDVPYAQRLEAERWQWIKEVRDESSRNTMFAMCDVLNEHYGKGYKTLVRFSLVFKKLIEEFYNNYEVGEDRVKRRLKSHGIHISGEITYIRVPGLTQREQERLDHGVHASYWAGAVGLIAINETFGLGKAKLENISNLTAEKNAKVFTEGNQFLLDRMKEMGFHIVNGNVRAYLDDNGEAVSYKKWLEANNG